MLAPSVIAKEGSEYGTGESRWSGPAKLMSVPEGRGEREEVWQERATVREHKGDGRESAVEGFSRVKVDASAHQEIVLLGKVLQPLLFW